MKISPVNVMPKVVLPSKGVQYKNDLSFKGEIIQFEENTDEIRQEIMANHALELFARLWAGEYIENVVLDRTQKDYDIITEYENDEVKRKSFFTKDGYLDQILEYEDM